MRGSGPSSNLAVLRVRRPSGRLATFEATAVKVDGGILWATGRWRHHPEMKHSLVYGFGPGEILEVRCGQVEAGS